MQRTQALGLILVALVLGFVVGFKSGRGAAGTAAPALATTGPALPVATAPPATPGPSLPRLVDLGSTTCIPCKEMAPILEELKAEYKGKVDVEFIDVNTNVAAVDAYKINLIPTQVFIDQDGNEVFRHEGFFPKADILAQFERMGIKAK